MSKAQRNSKPAVRVEVSGVERLVLRVSSMINHPIAQQQHCVKIHRLDTDGDREWNEVIGGLSETDGIEMVFNDEDDSVTLKWDAATDDDCPVEAGDIEVTEATAPF